MPVENKPAHQSVIEWWKAHPVRNALLATPPVLFAACVAVAQAWPSFTDKKIPDWFSQNLEWVFVRYTAWQLWLFAASIVAFYCLVVYVLFRPRPSRESLLRSTHLPAPASDDSREVRRTMEEIAKGRVNLDDLARPQGVDAVTTEIRRSICGKLNELSRSGNDLLNRMVMSGGYPSVEGSFNQWSKICEQYLSDSLGATAIKLFHSPTSGAIYNPMKMMTISWGSGLESLDYQSHLYDRIWSRVMRLGDIARMVESGEIEPC